ncbi:MAG: thioredoxin domain-containing protein [Alphaproteobacteria bacterium]|jgi:protein-disulfide isomerase
MLKLILIPFFLIISSFSQAKEYEYQQFLTDNEITPLVKSDADKTVDVIEFSSFSCSHCAAFHNETLNEIKESDVYKNINYYIVDYPLNQAAFYASIIANCNSDIKPSYIDSVYENYNVWTKSETGEEIIELLNNYGLQLGLEDEQLQSCLNNESLQNNILSLQVAAQSNFGVQSTPTFLIDGEKLEGNRPASEFIKAIKKKLKNK